MDQKWQHPDGLRPTLRHLMILIVYFALAAPLLRPKPISPNSINVTLLLPASPLLLSLLDRPGPVRFWLAGLLASLTPLAFMVWLAGLMVVAWLTGHGRLTWFLLVPTVLGFASLVGVAKRLPRRCPECGRRSLLPLGRRYSGIRWCASCGFKV